MIIGYPKDLVGSKRSQGSLQGRIDKKQPSLGPSLNSAGDSYYEELGNSGYDALHYDLDLKVALPENKLDARVAMLARSLRELDQFNLDFQGMEIEEIRVNSKPAKFVRKERELQIIPKTPIPAGQDFSVEVDYQGSPESQKSIASSYVVGWNYADGCVCFDSQPDGASNWFPVNDHPSDKASYSFRVEVPQGKTVAASGRLQNIEKGTETDTYTWASKDPMASYLATIQIGDYDRSEKVLPNGVLLRDYYPNDLKSETEYDFGRVPQMMEFFEEKFGPYPFDVYGGIVVDKEQTAGSAMEMQTLSFFPRSYIKGDRSTEYIVAHELAHQWFGNSLTVSNWSDLWLNEGWATYSEMLWIEHNQGTEAMEDAIAKYESKIEPGMSMAAPPKDDIFHQNVYYKGMSCLHNLRKKIGDEAFFNGAREYTKNNQNSNVTVDSLIEAMESSSGHKLGGFFEEWMSA